MEGLNEGGYTVYYYEYNNFYFVYEVEFTPTLTNINRATFSSFATHQIDNFGSIDWSKVSITTSPPFLSYSTNPFVDDPTFDEGIGAFLIFDNL